MGDSKKSTNPEQRQYLFDKHVQLGFSAEEMARRWDITKRYYYFILNGTRGNQMRAALLLKMVNNLGFDATELLEAETKHVEMYKELKGVQKN